MNMEQGKLLTYAPRNLDEAALKGLLLACKTAQALKVLVEKNYSLPADARGALYALFEYFRTDNAKNANEASVGDDISFDIDQQVEVYYREDNDDEKSGSWYNAKCVVVLNSLAEAEKSYKDDEDLDEDLDFSNDQAGNTIDWQLPVYGFTYVRRSKKANADRRPEAFTNSRTDSIKAFQMSKQSGEDKQPKTKSSKAGEEDGEVPIDTTVDIENRIGQDYFEWVTSYLHDLLKEEFEDDDDAELTGSLEDGFNAAGLFYLSIIMAEGRRSNVDSGGGSDGDDGTDGDAKRLSLDVFNDLAQPGSFYKITGRTQTETLTGVSIEHQNYGALLILAQF